MVKVSIIVPVYNVEKYLSKCLESLINQTLKDIEIVCVNDGSTDNSLSILKEYANKDSRIKIIDKQNEGVSVARNTGINAATGKYLMFADSDDYLVENACEKALNTIEHNNSDICIFGHYDLVDGKLVKSSVNKDIIKAQKQNNQTYTDFSINIWDKIYNREFLIRNSINFIPNLKTSEDVIFNFICQFNNPNVSYSTEPLYVYRLTRENSATSKSYIKSDIESLKQFMGLEIFKRQELLSQFKVVGRFLAGCYWAYKKFNNDNVKSEIYEMLKFVESQYHFKDLLKLKRYRTLKFLFVKNLLNNIFSLENTCDGKFKVLTILGVRFELNRGGVKQNA